MINYFQNKRCNSCGRCYECGRFADYFPTIMCGSDNFTHVGYDTYTHSTNVGYDVHTRPSNLHNDGVMEFTIDGVNFSIDGSCLENFFRNNSGNTGI